MPAASRWYGARRSSASCAQTTSSRCVTRSRTAWSAPSPNPTGCSSAGRPGKSRDGQRGSCAPMNVLSGSTDTGAVTIAPCSRTFAPVWRRRSSVIRNTPRPSLACHKSARMRTGSTSFPRPSTRRCWRGRSSWRNARSSWPRDPTADTTRWRWPAGSRGTYEAP